MVFEKFSLTSQICIKRYYIIKTVLKQLSKKRPFGAIKKQFEKEQRIRRNQFKRSPERIGQLRR